MATRTGFEPVSSAVTGRRNRPDYANEPYVIGGGYQSRTDECAVQGRRFPTSLIPRESIYSQTGLAGEIRTPDTEGRSFVLYPTELWGQNGAEYENRTRLTSLEG